MGFSYWEPAWGVGIVECILLLGALFWIFRFASGHSPHRRASILGHRLSAIARRRTLAITICGMLVLCIRLPLVPILGIPVPVQHDEFSFELQAETFLAGRLANPPHPMWTHFETFHVLQQPTYASMYPPGQGAVLAIGFLLGNPWFGQLLASALAGCAICWMLQGWLPPTWAFYGGLLAALRLGALNYWTESFFCGALPAIGGALLLGAWPRLRRQARLKDALWMTLGIVILANTRPYEGLVFSIPFAVAMLLWLSRRRRHSTARLLRNVVLPMALLLCASGAGMGYYFWRITGNPLLMPYEANLQTYKVAPYFLWQKPLPVPAYRHSIMKRFYLDEEYPQFLRKRTAVGFVLHLLRKARYLWVFFLGPLLTLPLAMFPRVLRDRRMKFPLLLGGFFALGLSLEVWSAPHYAAPAAGLVYLLWLQCARHLRIWRWKGRPAGLLLARAIPVIAFLVIAVRVAAIASHTLIEPRWPKGNRARADLVRRLEDATGRYLILVRYSPQHPTGEEWVYNAADIDASPIVWARDMGPDDNQELLQYYRGRQPDRQVLLLEPDANRMTPYSSSTADPLPATETRP